ncbi:MAG TPA: vitamin K epoxide reductase family protein [Kofleriaceae bacterium]
MKPPWLVVVLIGALIGLVFAGVSTYDFVQHLDRQVHSLHCSFIPGMTHGAGASGCQAAMMSPYSSILRTHVWGGIPIALGAMAVFAFLLFFTADLVITRRKEDPRAALFLVAACALPAATSVLMLIISLTKLGTTCKLCVCIYVASALVITGAIGNWRRAVDAGKVGAGKGGAQLVAVGASNAFLGAMFGIGLLFVAIPLVVYLAAAPDNGKFVGTCDSLPKPDDTYGVMVDVHRTAPQDAQAIEILDPLCPSCKAFEQQLESSGFNDKLDRRAILFPLDNTCNWMITETTHPGACTVSEAVLCAGKRAPEVIAWAFEEQDKIREDTAKDPTAAARYVKQKFPELAACVGSPEARSKLNKSLRWAVANNIHVLTPQLFIDNVKLCDEDVDLGLDLSLHVMLERHAAGTLAPVTTGSAAAPSTTPPPAQSTPPPPAHHEHATAPSEPEPAPVPAPPQSPPPTSPDGSAGSAAPAPAPAPAPAAAPAGSDTKPAVTP